ncbi:MAG: hypothetical protein PHT33_08450, partial [bacterium]|nr:hypothetical protein [bacterium]
DKERIREDYLRFVDEALRVKKTSQLKREKALLTLLRTDGEPFRQSCGALMSAVRIHPSIIFSRPFMGSLRQAITAMRVI